MEVSHREVRSATYRGGEREGEEGDNGGKEKK
jgi:hypothetical protein